jgi:membrane protease YdiL (CAAX protease family)
VLAVFFLAAAFWPGVGSLIVTETGLGAAVFGPETIAEARAEDAPRSSVARVRVALLAGALALPLQLLSVPLLLHLLSGTRPYQFGLTSHRLGRNALLGLLGWMLLTPPVLGINWLVTEAFAELSRESVDEHGFARLSQNETVKAFELAMMVFMATVAAPLYEELLFRGVLLSWLERNEAGSVVVMALAGAASVPLQQSKWQAVGQGEWTVLAPALFVLAMAPAYAWVRRKQRTPAGTALYASSLLFAMFHHSVWPSPIPLFVLALGLGWLAQRTRSLVGPMVLHGLFNGVACVQMLMGISYT